MFLHEIYVTNAQELYLMYSVYAAIKISVIGTYRLYIKYNSLSEMFNKATKLLFCDPILFRVVYCGLLDHLGDEGVAEKKRLLKSASS